MSIRLTGGSTLTVQDMTVCSTSAPTLPSIDTLAATHARIRTPYCNQAREERGSAAYSNTPEDALLTPYAALLEPLYHGVQYVHMEISIVWMSLYIFFHPRSQETGLSEKGLGKGGITVRLCCS